MKFYNQKEKERVMSVSSCNSVNSAIMYNMKIMIKMPFDININNDYSF